ncbi:MAG: hypothetical protein ABJQ90_18750 [Parasphingorhabdus sp.]
MSDLSPEYVNSTESPSTLSKTMDALSHKVKTSVPHDLQSFKGVWLDAQTIAAGKEYITSSVYAAKVRTEVTGVVSATGTFLWTNTADDIRPLIEAVRTFFLFTVPAVLVYYFIG